MWGFAEDNGCQSLWAAVSRTFQAGMRGPAGMECGQGATEKAGDTDENSACAEAGRGFVFLLPRLFLALPSPLALMLSLK